MSINKEELMEALDKISPFHLQESWDNSGLQIDSDKEEIHKILVALEVTPEVLAEAKEMKVDVIVTHHPLIFSPLSKINLKKYEDRLVFDSIKNNIGIYACHTNFDKADKGNNYYLAKLLRLKDLEMFDGDGEIGIAGVLENKVDCNEIIELLMSKLNLGSKEIQLAGEWKEKNIKKIGICTGAGGDQMEVSKLKGCDIFITGDFKYHLAIKAKGIGLMVVDCGHYGTEKIFVPNMANQLSEIFNDKVEIVKSKIDINPFIYKLDMIK